MKTDLNIISHIVLDDKIFIEGKKKRELKSQLGGPPAFASMAFIDQEVNVQIISSVGKDFPKSYRKYFNQFDNLSLKTHDSERTTRFVHKIFPNKRELEIKAEAENLDQFVNQFQGGEICIISPVFREIGEKAMLWAKANHNIIVIDVQGFLRDKDQEGKIIPTKNFELLQQAISIADIVKFSLNEAKSYTGKENFRDIFERLPKHNTQIITLGKKGLVYSNKGKIYFLNAFAQQEIDPTGAGDVLLVALSKKLLDKEKFDFSLAYGMALAAEKVKYKQIQPLKSKNYEKTAEKILETKHTLK
ncbi:MAG: PfkB family carbohydrate kinase [Candidatus Heimdallarchaeaceae archaeon]